MPLVLLELLVQSIALEREDADLLVDHILPHPRHGDTVDVLVEASQPERDGMRSRNEVGMQPRRDNVTGRTHGCGRSAKVVMLSCPELVRARKFNFFLS